MLTIPTNQYVLSDLLTGELERLYGALRSNLGSDRPVKLNIDDQRMRLFTATFDYLNKAKLFIFTGSIKTGVLWLDCLNSWSKQLNVKQTWHYISGELSSYEASGEVVTNLNLALYHLLAGSRGHHYLLPTSLLGVKLPNPKKYNQNVIRLHCQDKLPLTQLVKQLTRLGYRRSSSSTVAVGSMRVRGEQVEVRHPTHAESYIITFYGSYIEKIEQQVGRKKTAWRAVTLPPVLLPPLNHDLVLMEEDMLVLHPAHITVGTKTAIVYNALQPDYSFPLVKIPPSLSSLTKKDKKNRDKANSSTLVASLRENKPAVHSDHGIGIYEGVRRRKIDNSSKDYLILRYAAGDTLSVPVEYAHKVSAYLGDSTPMVRRLNSTGWKKIYRRAEHNAFLFARDLVKTAAIREQASRPGYYLEPSLETQLEESFTYKLTAGQRKAWREIKRDLRQNVPADRLMVGDVGFGKTELAVRAARHAVNNGDQVAILAPTTLLVQQHFDTLLSRLPDMADKISLLSRFSSQQDIRHTHRLIKDGRTKIVVGTHAILSKKIVWQRLGLVIIDEEQRFGVKQKEHYKSMRSNLNILSLSATPIPRTLYLSLSGLKQLSVINTAPAGRKNVRTYVMPSEPVVLRRAIALELKRGGQVYVVAPRISKLQELVTMTRQSVPQARVGVLHSRLPAKQIAAVMQHFDNQQIDVLVSSTIVANGLDLPNANTLIVTSATHFGLADLYQLRGRVGRRNRQGFAYFLFDQVKMTDTQRQRLGALTEATRLGSGWALARRDLEIRGAGNILGADQSGTVNAVGIQLYLDMVRDAVDSQTNQAIKRHDVKIHLPITAHIPTKYMPRLSDRTRYYQKLARARSLDELDQLRQVIEKRWGAAPIELDNLCQLIALQHLAADNGVTSIDTQQVTPPGKNPSYKISLQFLDSRRAQILPRPGWRQQGDQIVYQCEKITAKTVREIKLAVFSNP